jgi:hypothetical protein
MIGMTDPYGRNLGFLDRNNYGMRIYDNVSQIMEGICKLILIAQS